MTLFIRNKKNRTIVDLEFYKTKGHVELHSSVIIDTYSKFLLENLDRKDEIVNDFNEISELRGWLWESYFMGDENTDDKYDDILKILRDRLHEISKKYDLYYVED